MFRVCPVICWFSQAAGNPGDTQVARRIVKERWQIGWHLLKVCLAFCFPTEGIL